jgi:hypothetical protein
VLALGINVFDEASKVPDYRIPDFTFVAAEHEHLLVTDGVRGGGPEAVIEVRSPDDETYEKLPFFARIGVSEVIVIDRDTKRPEIYRLAGSQYVAVQPDRDGWLGSEALHVRFTVSPAGRLVLEDADDSSVRTEICFVSNEACGRKDRQVDALPLVNGPYWQETRRNDAPRVGRSRFWRLAEILGFTPEDANSCSFVPCLSAWLATQNPVGVTPREGSTPSSGTNALSPKSDRHDSAYRFEPVSLVSVAYSCRLT